ncbi:hypothetical protein [Mesorhizobium sp. M0768]|uniref:hypothetical protein n=1 Tax=unclassified Mesorhizobium TaxID=325217 RepID=UPI00333C1B75
MLSSGRRCDVGDQHTECLQPYQFGKAPTLTAAQTANRMVKLKIVNRKIPAETSATVAELGVQSASSRLYEYTGSL